MVAVEEAALAVPVEGEEGDESTTRKPSPEFWNRRAIFSGSDYLHFNASILVALRSCL